MQTLKSRSDKQFSELLLSKHCHDFVCNIKSATSAKDYLYVSDLMAVAYNTAILDACDIIKDSFHPGCLSCVERLLIRK